MVHAPYNQAAVFRHQLHLASRSTECLKMTCEGHLQDTLQDSLPLIFFKSSSNSKSCSCSKNHVHVSFRFFEGGSAIASQDKRLNHLFSTLGTMTMTHKVSAQSVPCHLLFKKGFVAFLQSSLSHARLFIPTSGNYVGKTTYMQLRMNVSDCIISIVLAIATP